MQNLLIMKIHITWDSKLTPVKMWLSDKLIIWCSVLIVYFDETNEANGNYALQRKHIKQHFTNDV